MSLTARERTRYARHLLLPEIGLAGQERLVATQVRLSERGQTRAAQVAQLYLERAGLKVEGSAEQGVPVADAATLERVAGTPALLPAAAALAGALAAVEAIKEVLQLGTKGDPTLAGIFLSPEDV